MVEYDEVGEAKRRGDGFLGKCRELPSEYSRSCISG